MYLKLCYFFSMMKSVVKSFKVPVVEVAELTNRFHWVLQWVLRYEDCLVCVAREHMYHVLWRSSQSIHMWVDSPNSLYLYSCRRWSCRRWSCSRWCPTRSCERVHCCFWFSLYSSSAIGGGWSLSIISFHFGAE